VIELDLSGEHAVVTGGASGIGLECTKALAVAGATTSIIDRDPAGTAVAKELGATYFQADVADEVEVDSIATRLEDSDAPPSILVTCAGILQRTLPPDELTWSEWDRVTRVHQRGTFACCRSFGSRMATRNRGAIVTIASVAGIRSGPLHAYGPAKAAIMQLTRTLAGEWGPSGVRVNSVAPGFTMTPAVERGLADGTLDSKTVANNTALGRLIEPAEIASAVVYLASPLASAITGSILPVDAGYLAAADWGIYGGLRD